MAEEKKQMSKAGRMYDHPTSAKHRKEQPGDAKKSDAKEESSEATAEAGESAGLDTMKEGMDRISEGYNAMLKAHESERSDMNGNHMAERKKMHGRQEQQIKDFVASNNMMGGAGDQADQGAAPAAEA